MRRALYISLILYLPLFLASVAVLFGEFDPRVLGSPLFKVIFLAWILDGFACLVSGIGMLRMLYTRTLSGGDAALLWPLSIIAVLFGIPPAYVLVDLAFKLGLYLY